MGVEELLERAREDPREKPWRRCKRELPVRRRVSPLGKLGQVELSLPRLVAYPFTLRVEGRRRVGGAAASTARVESEPLVESGEEMDAEGAEALAELGPVRRRHQPLCKTLVPLLEKQD